VEVADILGSSSNIEGSKKKNSNKNNEKKEQNIDK